MSTTDSIAWSNFCAWQAADSESRLFGCKADADAEAGKQIAVTLFTDAATDTIYGATLAECWEKFEGGAAPVAAQEAVAAQ